MRRLPQILAVVTVTGLLLGSAACGDTGAPSDAEAASIVGRTSQQADRADQPTTTTTTAPPTTTTAPPPPTTAAPARKPASGGSSSGSRTHTVVVSPASKPVAAASACTESGMLSMINRERARHSLAALTLRSGATSVACSWSRHMTSYGLAHNPHLSSDLAAHGVTGWKSMGENVGYAGSPSQVFSLFMGSTGHRDNILSTSYTQVGIGVVRAGSRYWVTFDFVGY